MPITLADVQTELAVRQTKDQREDETLSVYERKLTPADLTSMSDDELEQLARRLETKQRR